MDFQVEAKPSLGESPHPISGHVEYEDYQRNLRKYAGELRARSPSPPGFADNARSCPDLLSAREGLKASHLAQIGGFRREFVHRKQSVDEGGPMVSDSGMATHDSLADNHAANLDAVLAQRIDDSVRNLVFLFGSQDKSLLYSCQDGGGIFDERSTYEIENERLLSGVVDCHGVPRPAKKLSVWQACVTIFKAFIGTGILFMPQAVSNAGWLGAISMLAGSCLLSTLGILLLGHCHRVMPLSYPELARSAYGGKGYFMVSFQIALSQLCFCIGWTVFMEQSLYNILVHTVHNLECPHWATFLAITLVLVPFGWIRRIGKMSNVMVIGNILMVGSILIVSIVAIDRMVRYGVSPSITAINQKRWLCFVGTSAYIFEGIAIVIPVRESMERPELFQLVLTGMMFFFMILIGSFGLIGYCAWGQNVDTIILNDLPGLCAIVVQIAYIFVGICSFPVVIYPTFIILEGHLFKGMLPSVRRQSLKNGFRSSLTIIMGVAAFFAAADLSIFVSIVGSFCSIPLAFIFPPLLYMRIVGDTYWLSILLIVAGTVLVPLSLYIDILSWGT